ncbi:hypothetical protein NQ318_010830 [Aromia moschata]|uniref:Uncharacterized protein n=1 Tax=Aromia moschata TaxID=1265417 RepID=A0AAV8YH98_9CUCU|nr:hypothetical protein NQ318_010830 [Aromia moschata]
MFHMYWPATACLTLVLILGVIMGMLRWGQVVPHQAHRSTPKHLLAAQGVRATHFGLRHSRRSRIKFVLTSYVGFGMFAFMRVKLHYFLAFPPGDEYYDAYTGSGALSGRANAYLAQARNTRILTV